MTTREVVVISTFSKTYLINQSKVSSCLSIQICTLAMAESEDSRPQQGEEEKERRSEEEEEEPFSPLPESAEQVPPSFFQVRHPLIWIAGGRSAGEGGELHNSNPGQCD